MQGQTKIVLSSPRGLTILPSGDGGTRVNVGSTIEITLASGKPSQQAFSVVLQELKTGAAAPWTSRRSAGPTPGSTSPSTSWARCSACRAPCSTPAAWR